MLNRVAKTAAPSEIKHCICVHVGKETSAQYTILVTLWFNMAILYRTALIIILLDVQHCIVSRLQTSVKICWLYLGKLEVIFEEVDHSPPISFFKFKTG
jgi:hypothetical protein